MQAGSRASASSFQGPPAIPPWPWAWPLALGLSPSLFVCSSQTPQTSDARPSLQEGLGPLCVRVCVFTCMYSFNF